MSLIVSVNGIYQSYFNPEHIGTLNPNKYLKDRRSFLKESSSNQKKAKKNYEKAGMSAKPRLNFFAQDIMSYPINTISPQTDVVSAQTKMKNLNTHHLLIMEDKNILGIISDRDLLRALDERGTSTQKVSEIMTKKVLLCQRETEIRLIAQIMLEEAISCTPVVDENHSLVGIITKSDLLRCIINNMPIDVWI